SKRHGTRRQTSWNSTEKDPLSQRRIRHEKWLEPTSNSCQQIARSGQLVDGVDRLAQSELRSEAELGGRTAAVDHADVSDEVELGDWEARNSEAERERENRFCYGVWDCHGLPTELLKHGRERHFT